MSDQVLMASETRALRPAEGCGPETGFAGLGLGLALIERGLLPDALTRWGIRRLVASGIRQRAADPPDQAALRARLLDAPIAVETEAANQQHYELPAEFFTLALGPHRKYSSCYWPAGTADLAVAEAAALSQVVERAGLADGQRILELGCGWGSLTLWMASAFPRSEIVAVSNSAPQRRFIEAECRRRGRDNVTVITADMNTFEAAGTFDRVVSIEMFEHMRNHRSLMRRIAGWLRPDGRLFVHVFAYRHGCYLFETEGAVNWLGRYFFTGGIMPSEDLLASYQDDLALADQWWLNGTHYEQTANAWLANTDRHRGRILEIFRETYGAASAHVWLQRWRLFFLACAEMFGYAGGRDWGVGHYLFRRR